MTIQKKLTRNHFLNGQLGGDFAPESIDETVFDVRKRFTGSC